MIRKVLTMRSTLFVKHSIIPKRLLFLPTYLFCDKKPTQQQFKKMSEKMQQQIKFQQDQTSYQKHTSSVYVFGLAILIMLCGYIWLQVNLRRAQKKKNRKNRTQYTGKADIGGVWQLTDTKGNIVSNQTLKGTYYMIYFGFCNCPDICPETLHKLGKAIDLIYQMPQSTQIPLKAYFVTVDPNRDTPQKIQNYLARFNPSIIGLTAKNNNDPDLKNCLRGFKIYASKMQMQGKENYTIDHTVLIYLMDEEGQYITHLGSNQSKQDIAKKVVQQILRDQRIKLKSRV